MWLERPGCRPGNVKNNKKILNSPLLRLQDLLAFMHIALKIKKICQFFFGVIRGRKAISWIWFLVLAAAFYAFVINLPFGRHVVSILEQLGPSPENIFFGLTVPVVVFAASFIIFLLLLTRYTAKIILVPLTVLAAVLFYASWNYGIIYDFDMVRNFALTNPAEAQSYINTASIFTVLLLGVLPALIVLRLKITWPQSHIGSFFKRLGLVVSSFLVVGVIYLLVGSSYVSNGRNNHSLNREFIPYSFLSAVNSYVKTTYFTVPEPFKIIGSDAFTDNPQERPEVVVMILGETARAENYPENGYQRNTTPYTAQIPNYITFSKVISCGTSTAQSVPCLFSNMSRDSFKRSRAERVSNLLDVVVKSGFGVAWIDNDGGCQGVCERLPKSDVYLIDPAKESLESPQLCSTNNCYDEIVLKKLPQVIASLKTRNKFVVVHLKGSHGPTYFERTPKEYKKFTPSCERSDIQACSIEELINTYDNTILYTDLVIAQIQKFLVSLGESKGSGLLYLSDHGESLGEMGLYLHGMPYAIAPDTQTRVPLHMWFNQGFVADHKLNLTCLVNEGKRAGFYSHDNIFHSMLGLLDVATKAYNKKLDFFSGCR